MYFLQLLLNALVSGTQVLLVAVPLYLIYSSGRILHIGIGALSVAVAYGLYGAHERSGSWTLAFIFSLLLIFIFSALSHALLEPFVRKKQSLFALLTSFSLGVAVESVIAMSFGSDGKSIVKGVLPTIHFAGLNLTWSGFLTIFMGLIFFAVFMLAVRRTPFGRILRSLAESAEVSESLGANGRKVRFAAYGIALFLAGFVGIMSGLNTALTPYMGFYTIVLAFTAFLVGGTQSLTGTLFASYLMALAPQLIVGYSDFSDSWRMVFVFVLAAVLLGFRPRGIFNSAARTA